MVLVGCLSTHDHHSQHHLCDQGEALAFLCTLLFQGSKSKVSIIWFTPGNYLPCASFV